MSEHNDLRDAIRSIALVRSSKSTIIIQTEGLSERSAWLFDFRALMLQPKWLNRYAEIFWEKYADQYPFQVGGMETAAISLIAAIVMKGVERGTPVNGFYIRKSRKRQGIMKQVEGTLTDEPVILVDDLANNGFTLGKQKKVLESMGVSVAHMFVFLAFRDRQAYAALESGGTRFDNLFALSDMGLELPRQREIPEETLVERWHYRAPAPSHHLIVQKSAPILHGKNVLFGCDDGVFRALDQSSGAIDWEWRIGRHVPGKGILSSPAVHQDTVYFGAYDGNVYALDAATGKKQWTYSDADWVGSSPALAPERNMLFIGLEFGLFRKRGGIAALDMYTGREKWRALHPQLTHGSPLYIQEEDMVVIGSNDGMLYAYSAVRGTPLWQFQSQGDIKTRATYDAKRRYIFFGSMDGTIYALAASTGLPVYARETGAGIYSIPLIHNDTVYIASLDKHLYAIDMNTWKDRWEFATLGRIFSSPVLYDGSVWIGSNDGRLYEIDPENGKVRGYFQTTERVTNAIAFNETTGRIFIPTSANEIYCVERKNPSALPA